MAITAITFTACITSEDSEDAVGNSSNGNNGDYGDTGNTGSSSELIGEWKFTEIEDGMTIEMTIEMKSDGTYSMAASAFEMVMGSEEGTYSVDKSAGTITIEVTDCKEISDDLSGLETVDCDEDNTEAETSAYTVNGSTLTIIDIDDEGEEETIVLEKQ